jgi:lysophospholipase L1-like esterase
MPDDDRPASQRPLFVAGFLLLLVAAGALLASAGPRGSGEEAASGSGTPGVEPTPTEGPAAREPATEVPLPALVGAIGDSLTRATAASGQPRDEPEHSWVVGTDPDDEVVSHLERLRALGADPRVADASIAGARMESAEGQARVVVEAARALGPGEIAYVTVQLGANDLCGRSLDDATNPAVYEARARAAIQVLDAGLPAGSVLLVLSVPDVPRLAEIFPDGSRARALHREYGICPVALGDAADAAGARSRIAEYNGALIRLCDELSGSGLHCRHDQAGDPATSLFGAPFQEGEVSTLDFFHPSLAGQARIAEETWPLTPWGGR